jgi:hypothetical protein
MKTLLLTRHIVLAAAALVGAAGAAHAGTITPGSACAPLGVSAAGKAAISVTRSGIENRDSTFATHEVVCPVVRPTGAGVTVFIDGRISGAQPMNCSVSSFNFDGSFRASKLVKGTAPTFDAPAAFNATEAPTFAYLAASCFLPAFTGQIFGVIAL